MKIDLRVKLGQGILLTPQLKQAIKILQYSQFELKEFLDNELLENPVLEMEEESYDEFENFEQDTELSNPENDPFHDSYEGSEDMGLDRDSETMEYDNYSSDYASLSNDDNDKNNLLEKTIAHHIKFNEYVLQQWRNLSISEDIFQVGVFLIECLDGGGYLCDSIRNLIRWSNELQQAVVKAKSQIKIPQRIVAAGFDIIRQSTPVNVGKPTILPKENMYCYVVEYVLKKLQTLDPVGIAARNLEECLLIQARNIVDTNPIPFKIIQEFFPLLVKKELNKIGKKLRLPLSEIVEAYHSIQCFDPAPRAQFSESPSAVIIPDVIIEKRDHKLCIIINDDILPKVQINPFYRKHTEKLPKRLSKKRSQDKKSIENEYIIEKIRAGDWLLKSLGQRQKIIYEVTRSILEKQKDFFLKGQEHIKPMTLKDIAQDVDMHESTISRITTKKYIECPQGIFEMKFFFNSGIEQTDGKFASSQMVKNYIEQIISKENKKKPYTDDIIIKYLKEKHDITLARRTVSKYRDALKIPSSSKRKQLF